MFLSYARSSEEQATNAERALREEGYSVWRDSELPAHLSYAEVIEERLNSAKAVLVLWSAEAAKSQWVRAEADAARERGTLVQSSVDGTVPPIPFNQIQCANLKGWSGENDHAGWRKLHSSIVALAGLVDEPAKSSLARARKANSICVLPFQNKSGDDVPDYFSDGLSEDITTDLWKIPALSVTPLKKALAFKGKGVDPCAVAEKLGVRYVLEGAVLRAGDRVRITAQLIEGSTGEQVWSDRYHRDFSDIFSVQDEIAQAIVAALKSKLLPTEKEAVDDSGGKAGKTSDAPLNGRGDGEPSAFKFGSGSKAAAEPEPEIQDEPVSIWDRNFDEESTLAADAQPDAAEEWISGDEWFPGEEPTSRGFQFSDMLPRLIALGLVLLLGAALVGAFYWPHESAPVVEKEPELGYTVITTVNVRSLPSRYNSRILGTLEKGAAFNIVADLAGAQPDWVKIKDGPYVGGYVWRESTRPTEVNGTGGPGGAKTLAPRKDATG